MKANDVAYVSHVANQAVVKYLGFCKVSSLRYVRLEFADARDSKPRDVSFELSIFVFSMFSPGVVGSLGMFFSAGNTLAHRLLQTMSLGLRPHFKIGNYVTTMPTRIAPDSMIYRITVCGCVRKLRNVPKEST